MRQLKLFRWVAALTLAFAVAPSTASAQEDGTITISSTFTMDGLLGAVGADLAEVFANGHEHTWTLTLHGTTQTHHWVSTTKIHATSFDLEFFGPDAATLNAIVSEHIAGGEVRIDIVNVYGTGGHGFALWVVQVFGSDFGFETGTLDDAWYPLFPSDADGYPVVGPDPFSIYAEYSYLHDGRPGNGGIILSWEPLVTFEGSVGDPGGPATAPLTSYTVEQGNPATSGLALLQSSDNQHLSISSIESLKKHHTATAVNASAATSTASRIDLTIETGTNSNKVKTFIDLRNQSSGQWVQLASFTQSQADTVTALAVTSGASAYIGPGGAMAVRIRSDAPKNTPHTYRIDHVQIVVSP